MNTDYAHLRALAEKATPGPWEAETRRYSSDAGDYHASHIPGVVDEPASGYDIEPTGAMEAEDAEYIAAINPSTLIALLDELERLRREAEWEYECRPHPAYDWRPCGMPEGCARERRRRRSAGPWEPVEGETDD